jgi:hypothetical protein
MKNDDPRDPLAGRLRREAMAERPQFSEQLHERILRQIHEEPFPDGPEIAFAPVTSSRNRWRWLATGAAAAAIAGLLAISPWLMRRHPPSSDETTTIARGIPLSRTNPPLTAASFAAAEHPVNIGGILYARLWPPGVTVRLPESINDALPAPQQAEVQSSNPTAPPGSPEWLLAAIEEPAQNEASSALSDAIPPEARVLIGMAESRQ